MVIKVKGQVAFSGELVTTVFEYCTVINDSIQENHSGEFGIYISIHPGQRKMTLH